MNENVTLTPDLVGRDYDAEVRNNRSYIDEYLFYVTLEYSDTVEKGRIIRQSPEAGEVIQKGDTVSLVVSRGYFMLFTVTFFQRCGFSLICRHTVDDYCIFGFIVFHMKRFICFGHQVCDIVQFIIILTVDLIALQISAAATILTINPEDFGFRLYLF